MGLFGPTEYRCTMCGVVGTIRDIEEHYEDKHGYKCVRCGLVGSLGSVEAHIKREHPKKLFTGNPGLVFLDKYCPKCQSTREGKVWFAITVFDKDLNRSVDICDACYLETYENKA